jgi:hypothetical protein
MKRTLLTMATVALTVVVAPAAHATGDTIHGGCFLAAAELNNLTSDSTVGVIGDISVTQDGSGAPTIGTVTCWLQINGVVVDGTHSYSGLGVQAGANSIAVNIAEGDAVALCQTETYAGGTTPAHCREVTDVQTPLQVVFDMINQLEDVTDFWNVDPLLCPIFLTLGQNIGGGVPGVLEIHPDGDIIVNDPSGLVAGPLWDCPPYEIESPDDWNPMHVTVVPPPL